MRTLRIMIMDNKGSFVPFQEFSGSNSMEAIEKTRTIMELLAEASADKNELHTSTSIDSFSKITHSDRVNISIHYTIGNDTFFLEYEGSNPGVLYYDWNDKFYCYDNEL